MKQKYFKLYENLISDNNLTTNEKLIICFFLDFEKEAITNNTLIELLNCDKRQLNINLAKLKALKYIKIENENNKRKITINKDTIKPSENYIKINEKLLKNNTELNNQEKIFISYLMENEKDKILLRNETIKKKLNISDRYARKMLNRLKQLNYIDYYIEGYSTRIIKPQYKLWKIKLNFD